MKIQKLLTFILSATIMVNSCEKIQDGLTLPGNIKQDLTFTQLETIEVGYNSATIRVKHDGTSGDTWYGFVSDKPGNKDAVLIAEKLQELTVKGEIKGLDKRTVARIELTDLEPAKKYKYIVFAVTPDGQLYGTTKSITFTTEESAFLLTQSEDWSIAREGRNSSTNKETYSIQFQKNGAARCHVGFIPKWMVEYYENDEAIQAEIEANGGLRLAIGEDIFLFSILDYLVFEELYEYWGYYEGDETYFTQDTFSESSVFELPRQESGDYYAVAIGFNDGEPTFTYSANEVTVEKETPSESYNRWIGDWTITGANNISYNLTFEENDPNYSYYVYGWECNASVHDSSCEENCTEHALYHDFTRYELGIPFHFNALKGDINIKATIIGSEPTGEGEDMYYYNWGMFGYCDYEEEKVAILTPDDLIATAALEADATAATLEGCASVTYKYDTEENAEEVQFTYNSLGYLQYDDKTSAPTPWNLPVDLPATMVKVYSQPAAKAISRDNNGSMRNEMAAKRFKTIKANDYTKLKTAR